LHHIIAEVFNVWVLYLGMGGLSTIAALAMGELTNPLQAVWFLSKEMGYFKAHYRISVVFTWSFTASRVLLVPPWVAHILYSYHSKPNALPLPTLVGWSILPLIVMFGGFLWSHSLIRGLPRLRDRLRDRELAASTANERK